MVVLAVVEVVVVLVVFVDVGCCFVVVGYEDCGCGGGGCGGDGCGC